VGFLIFLYSAGIHVFLRFNVSILQKPLRDFTCLDLSILRTIISLLGHQQSWRRLFAPFSLDNLVDQAAD
jgi:hypothetical protein